MELLVLGGTKFLGRAAVEEALARGYEVTLFNRGRTNPELFPDVERLRGDREGDLSALEGRGWDAVIDPSTSVPHVVRSSADLLRDRVEHYLYISSISAYADHSGPTTEESPVAELGEGQPIDELVFAEEWTNYGALKALSEQVVRDVFGDRAAIVRSGLIVGPHDPTGRFTYWPHRIARGDDVLVPAPAAETVQFIDVRDLASWLVDLAERRTGGTFNATGPGVTWIELAETCHAVAGTDARLVWVDGNFLAEKGVGEWMELPLWIHDPEWAGMHKADVSRALAAGLSIRPLANTVQATLELAEPTEDAGLKPERERELLRAWATRG